MPNTLFHRIQSVDIDAQYDAACKSILSSKQMLAHILKATVEECQDLDIDFIRNHCIEKDINVSQMNVHPHEGDFIRGLSNESNIYQEGRTTFDICFCATFPTQHGKKKIYFNLEAQNQNPSYPMEKRGFYYLGRLISSQYGTEFKNSHYECLKTCYTIWICLNPLKKRRNTILRYKMVPEFIKGYYELDEDDYDIMNTIIINLGKPTDQENEGLVKMLEVLLSSERSFEEKKNILENEFHIEFNHKESEELEHMCNLSYGVKQKGIQEGIQEGIQKGIQEGIQKGIQTGIQKGIQEGIMKGKLEDIINLQKSMNISFVEALNLLRIPKDEQEQYIEMIAL